MPIDGRIIVGVAACLCVAPVALFYMYFSRGRGESAPAEDVDLDKIQAMSSLPGVPKIIWAFWEGRIPPLVSRCFRAFREKNPGYLVVVMNKRNAKRYTTVDLTAYRRTNDSIQRLADAVRLHVLAAYGGFWLDASIILQQPLDVFAEKMTKANAEFFAYTIGSSHDTPGDYTQAPVVENWFLGCTKGSAFMRAWRDEFMRLNTFRSVRAYVKSVRAEGVDLSRMNQRFVYYLASHVSARRVMTRGPGKYRLYLERSEDGPFKFEFDHRWRHKQAVKALAAGKYRKLPLIKLTRTARIAARSWSNPDVFFN